MATHTWTGATGGWTDPVLWSDGVVPALDDTELLLSGTAEVPVYLDAETIDLGSADPAAPAALAADGAALRNFIAINSTAPASFAALDISGITGFGGAIDAASNSGTFAIDVSAGSDLIQTQGSSIGVSGGDTMSLTGTLLSHGNISVGSGGVFVDNGAISLTSSAFTVLAGGSLEGTGTIAIGLYSSVHFESGAESSDVAVQFIDVGGRLTLADPVTYTGIIANFQIGDLIDLTNTIADSATFDASNGILTVEDAGNVVATLNVQGPASGSLEVQPDGSGGSLIEVPGSAPRLNYTLAADDRAMGSDIVRATLATASGAPIDGSGVKIGIISNSFDQAQDTANAAAQAGYLPLDPATGTCAVTVLDDAWGSGDDNEGQAMAELIHQAAPGAQLYFDTGEGGLDSFASAVTALHDAGCTVIVDDLSYQEQPFFQDAGPLDAAIDAAVASGVSYFSSAGNSGDTAYQAAYTPQPVTLYDGAQDNAEIFSNGSPYQTITLRAGITVTIALQWAAPWASDGQSVPGMLSDGLFDANGDLIDQSVQVGATSSASGSGSEPETLLTYTSSITTQYQLYIAGDLPAGTMFKYVMFGVLGNGNTVPGTIDDPAANAGRVIGHAMLPDVNAIGAVNFAVTPAFGSPATYVDYYSNTGGSQFLFDPSGAPLATPQATATPALVAPVGAGTSLTALAPFSGTSAAAPNAAAVAALMLQADPSLTPAQITHILTESATDLGLPADQQGAGLINADAAVKLALAAACYAEGTRLATERGPVPIERLRVGDMLRTAGRALRPLIWLGRRHVDAAAHEVPEEVWPVRVQAHAFSPNCPARDLFLSPDHAVWWDGVLIPIRYLINGASVAQIPVPDVTYWHVELPTHDVVLAENLAAETYLDTGNRSAFDGTAGMPPLPPAEALAIWQAHGCTKLAIDGPVLAAARARLLKRAESLGHRLGEDAALCVLANDTALDVRVHGATHVVALPLGMGSVRLYSRSFVPAHTGVPDSRSLGVAIAGLQLDGIGVALDDARLGNGWHAPEPHWRWTGGDGVLHTGGARELAFDVILSGRYWVNEALSARAA